MPTNMDLYLTSLTRNATQQHVVLKPARVHLGPHQRLAYVATLMYDITRIYYPIDPLYVLSQPVVAPIFSIGPRA
jgi:hypothetical protein